MKKLLVSDFDGTFYVNEEDFKNNKESIKKFKEKNNLFVISTGNNYEHFLEVVKKNNIMYDYLILDQGSVISNSDDKIIYSCCIEHSVAKSIYQYLKNMYISNIIQIYSPFSVCNNINENQITKISIRVKDLSLAREISKKINLKYKEWINAYIMAFDDINIVDIASNVVDKEKAIRKISKIEGIADENIYTIGNGYNDISMVEGFNGYCMKNSVKELLNKCNNQVNSVSELIKKVS